MDCPGLKLQSVKWDVTKSPELCYDPSYTALFSIMIYVTVLVVLWCVNIVCVCSFILCDFVHVCANVYVAICTITCKAHHMLWHCLFSTRYSEQQLLYHTTVNVCCSEAVQCWTLSLWPPYIWYSLYCHSKCRVAEQQHTKSFPCLHCSNKWQ